MDRMRRISGEVTLPDAPKAVGGGRPSKLPGRYRLGDVIGEGGMGRVYRAHDAVLGRDVAIKVIEIGMHGTDGAKRCERFAREARATARLAHPNIVGVHDVDPEAGWLVMDLIEGASLKDLGRLPPASVRAIADQVLRALDAAHAAGVIHRDVKPSNVIVDDAGKATLVDFGVARLVDAEMTRTGETIGTPAYMAPEQLRGAAVDERSDLYGLGATLYELVTGDRLVAFESPGETARAKLAAACAGDPVLADVIGRCLRGEPSARPASARDALAELARAPRRRRRWVVAVATAIVVGGGAIAFAMTRGSSVDARLATAFADAQRGEHEKAQLEVDDYLAEHPDDPDAVALRVLVYWWREGLFDITSMAHDAELSPPQRAMVHGIHMMSDRKDNEAIAFLESAAREHPDSVEIAFALGEARWHGGFLDRGAATLEQAYALDPRWQMALHHVVELRLARREAARLRTTADLLATVDPPRAAALECEMAISDRRYAAAAGHALAALAREPIPEVYVCLAEAYILMGRLDRAEATVRNELDLWPIDLREWGGIALEAELLLYRGRYAHYLDELRGRWNRQQDVAKVLWNPEFGTLPADSPGLDPSVATSPIGMRGPPLGKAMVILAEHLRGHDATAAYATDLGDEIRAYGRGLGAQLRGDLDTAATELRRALAIDQKGDCLMLIAYSLASVLHERGDDTGAAAACREVLEPAQYYPYRAVLVPDCVLWSGDRARWKWLSDAWTGEFEHPAIVEIRRRLARR